MASREKAEGIHYTPAALAEAVAVRLASEFSPSELGGPLHIADPASGDGGLLQALVHALHPVHSGYLHAHAFDLDPQAVEQTRRRLTPLVDVTVEAGDFLERAPGEQEQATLFSPLVSQRAIAYDAIIANPPYVRTQVLGAARAQALAARYGLEGRVDLAYAFVIAMVEALSDNGLFAIILSNKFLTIKAGATLRSFLRSQTELVEVWDLGDSQLFPAAVLPAVIFGRRRRNAQNARIPFRSLYQIRSSVPEAEESACTVASDVEALRIFAAPEGVSSVNWKGTTWGIRTGHLAEQPGSRAWILEDSAVHDLQASVSRTGAYRFGDVFRTSVGIKTTAASVFIRNDWERLPEVSRPESEQLKPIRLTADIDRWAPPGTESLTSRVLYPYRTDTHRRTPVELGDYPGAAAYLEKYREQLEGRRYVIESGRQWFEPWVAHQPKRWALPRLIFRDIAASPIFCVDESGAIPNGTLYWSIPHTGEGSSDLLWAACAIANSKWGEEYYDLIIGTKLYAGRRRYNTQAVDAFPFPREDEAVRELALMAIEAANATRSGSQSDLSRIEDEIDLHCRNLFGQRGLVLSHA